MTIRSTLPRLPAAEFNSAFPNSRKVYVDGPRGVRVPMREIALSGDEPPLRVYDSSGPQGLDVRGGLPQIRREWIIARGDVVEEPRLLAEVGSVDRPMPPALAGRTRQPLRGPASVTQLHYARRGIVTPEMEFIAIREGFDAEFVRS